jgi:hypothetical protein
MWPDARRGPIANERSPHRATTIGRQSLRDLDLHKRREARP